MPVCDFLLVINTNLYPIKSYRAVSVEFSHSKGGHLFLTHCFSFSVISRPQA